MITSADTQFGDLRVWIDANENGITDTGELKTLSDLNITEINLAATALTNSFINTNALHQ